MRIFVTRSFKENSNATLTLWMGTGPDDQVVSLAHIVVHSRDYPDGGEAVAKALATLLHDKEIDV